MNNEFNPTTLKGGATHLEARPQKKISIRISYQSSVVFLQIFENEVCRNIDKTDADCKYRVRVL